MVWRGWTPGDDTYKKKRMFFVKEKFIRDIKQGQQVVPDLLESIMKPTRPVKGELRRKTMNMNQFRPNIQEFGVSTFWMSAKSRISCWGRPAAAT